MLETPASPIGRIFALVIVLFFIVAVAWAMFGKVDIIATAQGRILPAGDIKIVQPLDPGVVRAIHVQDGEHVREGQLLIELDPTQTGADRDRLSSDLMQARLDVARLNALSAVVGGDRPPGFVAPADVPPERLAETRAAMRAQADQQAARLADLSQQIAQKDAEAAQISAETDKINATMPMLAEKERIHHDLTIRGYGTSLADLDAQQQLASARHDLNVQTQRTAEVVAARAALERQREGARAQYAADILSDLRKAEDQQNQLTQELIKAQVKSAATQLRSPIDGVVEQLEVHSLHGVVMPAQHLMIVVPDSRNLTIEAQLANRDVGFVHAGQPVKVKVETFNFTRYGLLDGHVVDVSRDVVNPGERQEDGGPSPTTPNRNVAPPAYVVRIALSKTSMVVDGSVEPLQPGMTVTAEIKTGERTIIDYLLSPIARKTQESLHER
ncbi:MAG TPA: HlyD family type I secretion periplasmic adaptor subunit [Caulobacteraceae bacterium]|nr:HlyD family type I secretion periplasmic adaptor subunit [Caulobacteraceae bacterium]